MRIGISSDRSGHGMMEHLRIRLSQAHELLLESPARKAADDFRSTADRLCTRLRRGRIERALLICAKALGASMAANKMPGVRAALCHDVSSVSLAVQEHNMNCLVIDPGTVTVDLACLLANAFCAENPKEIPPAPGISARNLISIIDHIRTNLNRPLDVNRLSELAAMSPSHFSKLFKISMGVSPHQFILVERVDRSKQLLRNSSAKIVDIAFAVGFETQAHFTTVFGNLVGMTPMQFRRMSAESSALEPRMLQVRRGPSSQNAGSAGSSHHSGIPITFAGFERTGSDPLWLSQ